MTHIPGPWMVGDAGDYSWVETVTPRRAIASLMRYPEMEANARVMAAAPDLLAALKAMVASYDGLRDALTCRTVIGKLAAADAAIAKAEGK